MESVACLVSKMEPAEPQVMAKDQRHWDKPVAPANKQTNTVSVTRSPLSASLFGNFCGLNGILRLPNWQKIGQVVAGWGKGRTRRLVALSICHVLICGKVCCELEIEVNMLRRLWNKSFSSCYRKSTRFCHFIFIMSVFRRLPADVAKCQGVRRVANGIKPNNLMIFHGCKVAGIFFFKGNTFIWVYVNIKKENLNNAHKSV